jgi:hypothetical protein
MLKDKLVTIVDGAKTTALKIKKTEEEPSVASSSIVQPLFNGKPMNEAF